METSDRVSEALAGVVESAFSGNLLRWLREGDETLLQMLTLPRGNRSWADGFAGIVGPPGDLDAEGVRLLRALHVMNARRALGEWASRYLEGDGFSHVLARFQEAGLDSASIDRLVIESVSPLDAPGGPATSGKYLLSLPPDRLRGALMDARWKDGLARTLTLLARHGGIEGEELVVARIAPLKARAAQEILLEARRLAGSESWSLFVRAARERNDRVPRERLLILGAVLRPKESTEDLTELMEMARRLVVPGDPVDIANANAVMDALGELCLPLLVEWMEKPMRKGGSDARKRAPLAWAALTKLGLVASPLLEAAARKRYPDLSAALLAAALKQEAGNLADPSDPRRGLVAEALATVDDFRFNELAKRLLISAGMGAVDLVAAALSKRSRLGSLSGLLPVALQLARLDPEKFRQAGLEAAQACLANRQIDLRRDDLQVMMRIFGSGLFGDLKGLLARWETPAFDSEVLRQVVGAMGAESLPLLEDLLSCANGEAVLESVRHLAALGDFFPAERLSKQILAGLSLSAELACSYCALAAKREAPELREKLFDLLGHSAASVRMAAASALAEGQAGAVFDRAAGLVSHGKSGAIRGSAAILLSYRGAPQDLRLFQMRLGEEAAEEARDALWKAVSKKPWPFPDPLLSDEMLERIVQAVSASKVRLPDWIPIDRLSAPCLVDGRPLPVATIRYVLARQNKRKGEGADDETKALVQRLAPASRAELGTLLLDALAADDSIPARRWVLALVGVLADDTLISRLSACAIQWAQAGRRALAEGAVQALAVNASNAALRELDGLSRRAKGKLRAVAALSGVVFKDAAKERGLDPEDLSDLLVPALGFDTSGRRLAGNVEITVSPDFSLVYRDQTTQVRSAKPPKGLSAAIRSELRELAKDLSETARVQSARLESHLISGRRYEVARFRELFLANPVLFPFAMRLVWGVFSESGEVTAAFRALADRSLTTVADDPFDLPAGGRIGLVHPVQLEKSTLEAWISHMREYEVEPPFRQLLRGTARVAEDRREALRVEAFAGKATSGFTLRGRGEKLGWRASSFDGAAHCLYRSFPAAGIDALLAVEDYLLAALGESEPVLGVLVFTPSSLELWDTWWTGSTDAPALIPLGNVPPVVYAEAVADVEAFAGSAQTARG